MRGTHRQMQSIPLAFRQELPVTVFRHPLRSRQMAIVNTPSPLWLLSWINTKQDLNGFCPVRTIRLGVEEAHIELEVLFVVVSELICVRCLIENSRLRHRASPLAICRFEAMPMSL